MIKLITNHHGAFDSPDHINPVGSINDNSTNQDLLSEVLDLFGRKIKVLDLGCSGGQFIIDFLNQGNYAVGLEGSSTVLNGRGKNNWDRFYNKNLFLCDITKKFKIYDNDVLSKFDFIHSSEVLEHIKEVDLPTLLNNVINHMNDDGIFCLQIGIDNSDPLHVSIFDRYQWINIFEENGFSVCYGHNDEYHVGYLFNNRFRDHIVYNSDGGINYGTSIYFCLKKRLNY